MNNAANTKQGRVEADESDISSTEHLVDCVVICEGWDGADEIFGLSCWSRDTRIGISDALLYLLENGRDTIECVEELGCILDSSQDDLTAQHARRCTEDDMRPT